MIETWWSVVDRITGSPATLTVSVLIGAVLAGWLIVRTLRFVVIRIARRTAATWDDKLVAALSPPVSVVVALQTMRATLPWLPLDPDAAELFRSVIVLLTIVGVVWAVFRAIDFARTVLQARSWAVDRPATRSLISLGGRFAKGASVVFASLVTLSQLGVSIASLLAGLGIGGLVIALAAQKTVENLFGTVSIGIDQPMREGDTVRVYGVVGTVERIGLRSSRIRTLDRTILTIPNGELSNHHIESLTERDRMRLSCTIGLVYATTAAQLRDVLADLEQILRDHPRIWSENIIVRFVEFADSSLDVEVMAWFETRVWNEFLEIRQGVLIAFMEAIERRGTSIAFPTRTVHVAELPPGAPPPATTPAAN